MQNGKPMAINVVRTYLVIHNNKKVRIIPKNIWEEQTCGCHLHVCQSKYVYRPGKNGFLATVNKASVKTWILKIVTFYRKQATLLRQCFTTFFNQHLIKPKRHVCSPGHCQERQEFCILCPSARMIFIMFYLVICVIKLTGSQHSKYNFTILSVLFKSISFPPVVSLNFTYYQNRDLLKYPVLYRQLRPAHPTPGLPTFQHVFISVLSQFFLQCNIDWIIHH